MINIPTRISKRISRKAKFLPSKVCPKRKSAVKKRKSALKKRNCGIDSSLLNASEKIKKDKKSKLNISNQISKPLKQSSHKIDFLKIPRKNVSKTYGHKRKTRNSLKENDLSVAEAIDEASLENSVLEKSKEKKVVEKKSKQFLNNKNLADPKSIKVPEKKGRNKEITHSAFKERKGSPKKSSVQITGIRSKSPNPQKGLHASKYSDRKKSAPTPASKLLIATPVRKATGTFKPMKDKKSVRLSKELAKSQIKNLDVSLSSNSFLSFSDAPNPKKHALRRKSSLLEPSPYKTPNKDISTPVFLNRRNPDSFTSKSPNSSKYEKYLSLESQGKKQTSSKVPDFDIIQISRKKLKQNQRQISQYQKTSEKFRKLINKTSNIPLDVLITPTCKQLNARTFSKKWLSELNFKSMKKHFDDLSTTASKTAHIRTISKSVPKPSKRKTKDTVSENHLCEELQDAKKRKSAGDILVDDFESPSKCRSMKKSKNRVKTDYITRLRKKNFITPKMNIQGKSATLSIKQPRRRVGTVPPQNKDGCLITVSKRKDKSTGDRKTRKPEKKPIIPSNESNEFNNIIKKAEPVIVHPAKTKEYNQVILSKSLPIKEDCLAADSCVKKRRTKSAPLKNKLNDRSFSDRGTYVSYQENMLIKTLTPVTHYLNENESSLRNSVMTDVFKLPIDSLSNEHSYCYQTNDIPVYICQKRINSRSLGNKLTYKISTKNDLPSKGTLKRKRWLLNNLKEKNECYEDDIFENQNFNLHKSAFYFGDESDGGSSVNIATPKFDCILTPALPKKTPRFKDCISPAELLQARKSAEEYLVRRNKKRKSREEPSSGKKRTKNESEVQDIPEKKKIDFGKTMNKLIEVQKNLKIQAEIGDEEEDSYFSDGSN